MAVLNDLRLRQFFLGKTVFVTGHTGFKGGWLCVWLKELGARVVGYSLAPEHGRRGFFSAACVAEGMASIIGDVRNRRAVQSALRRHRPSILFHLAAQPLVLRSYQRPLETFDTNVMGTAQLLDCARSVTSLRSIVVVTSDKCYADPEQPRPRREDDPLGGGDPYSASKGAAEIVAAAYRRAYFRGTRVGMATARAGNVIGGGDWADARLLPDCIRALAAGKDIVLRHPAATRPWQHVLEPVYAYLTLAAKLYQEPQRYAQAWNFGPAARSEISARAVAALALKSWGPTRSKLRVASRRAAPPEAAALRLDCSKARRLLGLQSLLTVEKAVALCVDWYRAQARDDGFDGRALTLSQIKSYG